MVKTIIASALLIFSMTINAKESAEDLGHRFVTCSADALTLSKILKNKDYRVRVINRSDKWFMASMFSFIESGIDQDDAWGYSSSFTHQFLLTFIWFSHTYSEYLIALIMSANKRVRLTKFRRNDLGCF